MNLENDNNVNEGSVEDVVERYRPELKKLTPYLKWLKSNASVDVAQAYSNSELKSMSFPIYVYSRNRLRNYKDELLFIEKAGITEMDELSGILSKYILSGMTKGTVWAEGVNNGVLYSVVNKMNELVEFWGQGEGTSNSFRL